MPTGSQLKWYNSRVQLLSCVRGDDATAPELSPKALKRIQKMKPMGCGIIISQRHILTCTHVVMDCVARSFPRDNLQPNMGEPRSDISDAVITARFPFQEGIGTERLRKICRYQVKKWCPHQAAFNALDDLPNREPIPDHLAAIFDRGLSHDLCLLELVGKSVLPEGWCAAERYEYTFRSGERFLGAGFTPDNDDVECDFEGEISRSSDHSIKLGCDNADRRIRSGCSGAGVFALDGRLIGMVTDKIDTVSGIALPVNKLYEFAEADWAPPDEGAGAKIELGFKYGFDRVDARDGYRAAITKAGRKLGCVYIISATPKDHAFDFFERLRFELGEQKLVAEHNFTEYFGNQYKKPTAPERFKEALARHRSSGKDAPAAAIAPLVFEAKIPIVRFASPEVQGAIKQIANALETTNTADCDHQVIFLITVEVNSGDYLGRGPMGRSFDEAIEALKEPSSSPIARFSLANLFRKPNPAATQGQGSTISKGPLLSLIDEKEAEKFVFTAHVEQKFSSADAGRRAGMVKKELLKADEQNWQVAKHALEEALRT